MRSKLGGNSRPGIDWKKLLDFFIACGGVSTHVFECYPSELHRLHDFLPWVDLPIWRPIPDEGETWDAQSLHKQVVSTAWTDARIVELTAAGFKPGQVALHLHNEAEFSPAMLAWELRAAQYAVNRKWAVVGININVGKPERDQIPLAKDWLAYAAEHPDLVYTGLHEYLSITGDRKAPYYLRRWAYWELYRKADGVNIGSVKYVITEFGAEDIVDDEPYASQFGEAVGPVHTLDGAWKKIYGDAYINLEDQYFKEILTALDVGMYLDEPAIAGVCLFTWGAGGRWAKYDISGMTELLKRIAKWAKDQTMQPTPPPIKVVQPPALPDKESPLWEKATLVAHRPGASQNLRNTTFTEPAFEGHDVHIVQTVPDGAEVYVWNSGPFYVEGGKTWYGVRYTANDGKEYVGWMALVHPEAKDQFKLVTPPPEETPNPDPDPDPDDTAETPVVTPEPVRDMLFVLKQQYKFMKIYADNLKARIEALDMESQAAQANLVALNDLIEVYEMESPA